MPKAAVELLLAEPLLLLCKVSCGELHHPITSGTPCVSALFIFLVGERIGQKSLIHCTYLTDYKYIP